MLEKYSMVDIDWLGSKEPISRFFAAGLDYTNQNNDSSQVKIHENRVERLLFDLGHNKRGLDDFPSTVSIGVTSIRPQIRSFSQLHTNLDIFYQNLADQIEDYFQNASHHPYKDEIETIRLMSEISRGETLQMLVQGRDRKYRVRTLRTTNYEFNELF